MQDMPDKQLTPEQRQENKSAVRHLKEWMQRKNATQEKVAEALDVSQVMVSKWLNGYIALPVKQLMAIARFLNVEPGDLFIHPDLIEEKKAYKHLTILAQKMDQKSLNAWIEIGKQLTDHK